jgi:hypothetical protein
VTQEIESVKPALTVILDDGECIISSTGPVGKAMTQVLLPLVASSRRVVVIGDGEMKVMKRNGIGQTAAQQAVEVQKANRRAVSPPISDGPDIQESYISDLESGLTGEQAMGEAPAPTTGPSDPIKIPSPRRKPQIFQDAAAPPAPELAEAEMDRLLQEAALADQEASRVQEQQRFQQQQAVQAGAEQTDAADTTPKPRKREPRALATSGRPCGRCQGRGQIIGEAGFTGACPVCLGQGTVKTWDRSLKVR